MRFLALIFFTLPTIAFAQAQANDLEKGERLFSLKVRSILENKCFACHGGKKKVKGDLDLTSRAGLLKGGETAYEVLVPFKPEKSMMVTAIEWADEDYEMPPKESDRLSAVQITQVKEWIQLGAPWPSREKQKKYREAEREKELTGDGQLVKTSGGLSEDWTWRRYQPTDIWAFLPLKNTAPPAGKGNPIDRFIQARLAQAGLKPAPWGDTLTLVRRATYDLTGLPPSPEEIDAFLLAWKKNAHEAYKGLLDRLLASPHYGERWGQHWLDVARYADTSGFSNDYERSNAWRYRDYVIRSFNEDKPYSRFVLEQIAGEDLQPNHPELIVAQGFLRMGPWEHTAMTPNLVSRQNYIDDVVNNVGQVFLGTPLRCAKCHDHKFDPIPTRDYYRLYAALATTQPAERPAGFLDEENRDDFIVNRKRVEKLLAIAREMNLGETSFVLSPRKSDFRARYFTLDGEIPLAGHPTVATVHALIESGQLVMGDGPRTISLEIGAGVIDVDVEIEDTTRVTMTQMKPQFLDTVALDMVLESLGLEAAERVGRGDGDRVGGRRDGEGGGVDRRQHLKHTHVRGERVPVLDDWFACDAHECFACDVCVRVVHQCMTVGAP